MLWFGAWWLSHTSLSRPFISCVPFSYFPLWLFPFWLFVLNEIMSVEHQVKESVFLFQQADQRAVLEYQMLDDSRVEFTSTYVPFSMRGKGIADKLVEAGLLWARQQGYEISSRCWYVDKFL